MLETPKTEDDYSVFPGESWFFFWRCAPSLWKANLEKISGELVVLPINWALYSDDGFNYDFGEKRPETNFLKLFEVIKSCNKQPVLLVPIGPCPFLSNGGIPHGLISVPSQNRFGLVNIYLDMEGNTNTIYSFFEPRIFQQYSRFLSLLAAELSKCLPTPIVVATEFGQMREGVFTSCLEDYSSSFQSGLHRYFQIDKKLTETNLLGDEGLDQKASEFLATIKLSYIELIKKYFRDVWGGTLQLALIGGTSDDFYERIYGNFSSQKYLEQAEDALMHKILVSSSLLGKHERSEAYADYLKVRVDDHLISSLLSAEGLYENASVFYQSLIHLSLLRSDNTSWSKAEKRFRNLIDSRIGNSFEVRHFPLIDSSENEHFETLFVNLNCSLNESSLKQMLRQFMNGHNVIISKQLLDETLMQRLKIFIMENGLKQKTINSGIDFDLVEINNAKLMLLDSKKLKDASDDIYKSFWFKILESLPLKHPEMVIESGVKYFWKSRSSLGNELKFEEVRRVYFCNPTSYKKTVKISHHSSFYLLKVLDEKNVSLDNTHSNIQLSMLPGSRITLDFGVTP